MNIYTSRVTGVLPEGVIGDTLGYPVKFTSHDDIEGKHGIANLPSSFVQNQHTEFTFFPNVKRSTQFTAMDLIPVEYAAKPREVRVIGGRNVALTRDHSSRYRASGTFSELIFLIGRAKLWNSASKSAEGTTTAARRGKITEERSNAEMITLSNIGETTGRLLAIQLIDTLQHEDIFLDVGHVWDNRGGNLNDIAPNMRNITITNLRQRSLSMGWMQPFGLATTNDKYGTTHTGSLQGML